MILQEILDASGVDYKTTSKTFELVVCCPFCTGRGFPADTDYHLGLNVKAALAHCFRCDYKARGLFYIARQLCTALNLDMSVRQLVRSNGRQDKVVDKEKPAQPEVIKVESDIQSLIPEYEQFDRDKTDQVQQAARRYLKWRGVSIYQVVKHQVGFAAVGDFSWRVLFPVQMDDGVVGCVGRAIRPVMKPKYLNTTGIKSMWNAQKPVGTAVVSEGIMDALRVEQALNNMRGKTAVARLGSAITTTQLDQLREFEDILILPDWDQAGIHGAIELADRCDSRNMRVKVAVPKEMSGLDPGSTEVELILDQIREALPWSKAAEWRLREAAMKEVVNELG